MKILQLCHKVPFPPQDGGCIAMNNLTEGLIEQGWELRILTINTKKHFIDILQLPAAYRAKTNIESVFVDTEIRILGAIKNLFSNKSYNVDRFYSVAFENKIIEVLKKETFDIIQLESIYVSMYEQTIRKYSKAKIVLRAHNVEHEIWENNAMQTKNLLKRWYLNLLSKRLKEFELEILKGMDAILSITHLDESYFKSAGFSEPIFTVPFGLNLKTINDQKVLNVEPNSLFHIGAMDWQPNIVGVNWFLREIWDMVIAQQPDLKIYLAGRNMNSDLKNHQQKNVKVVGEVKSASEFIRSKELMVVPLLSGGGMRIKIIEAMAQGKCIISTSIGAEGIAYDNEKNILIADTIDEFVAAIKKCIEDKAFRNTIGNNARMLVQEKYDNQKICKELSTFYHNLIAV